MQNNLAALAKTAWSELGTAQPQLVLLFCCMNRLVITLIDTLTLGWAEKQK